MNQAESSTNRAFLKVWLLLAFKVQRAVPSGFSTGAMNDCFLNRGVLEAVGRGASKTSEIAARPGTAQTNLGRTIASAIQPCVFGCGLTPRNEATGTASRLKKKTTHRKVARQPPRPQAPRC
jgi:hypothetical protein